MFLFIYLERERDVYTIIISITIIIIIIMGIETVVTVRAWAFGDKPTAIDANMEINKTRYPIPR